MKVLRHLCHIYMGLQLKFISATYYASISKTGLKHHLFIARRLDVRVDCKNKNMSRCMFGLFNCQNDLEYT